MASNSYYHKHQACINQTGGLSRTKTTTNLCIKTMYLPHDCWSEEQQSCAWVLRLTQARLRRSEGCGGVKVAVE